MKKKILKLDVDAWLTDRRIRLCTPAARAFLIDLRALCVPSGRLVMDDQPLSDDQIALLCGYTAAKVRELFKELGTAKAFHVDEDGLFFADMVKDSKFKAQAKVSGSKGASKKLVRMAGEAIRKKMLDTTAAVVHEDGKVVVHGAAPIISKETFNQMKENVVAGAKITKEIHELSAEKKPLAPVVKKPAPWYKTPAGWVRKGQEQGLSMAADEAYETFQLRVAKRLPEGAHLDYVPASVAKAVRAEIEEGKAAIKAAIPEQFRG